MSERMLVLFILHRNGYDKRRMTNGVTKDES